MFSKKGMSLIAVLGLLIFSVYAAAGPNANAVLSLDLIADGGAGNGTGDGVTSGTVSGQGTTIAIEIFATGVRTSLIGMTLEFDFDSSLLSFVEAENSAFPLVLPEGSTGTNFGTRNPVTLASSGFLARAEFTTVSDVTGTEFSIGIESVTLAESTTSSDELITTSVITFNASPSPDFDGDDWVGFSDFLIFAQVFGSRRGDGTYDARIDLNSDGSIGFTDFLIFAQSFGSAPPSTGGGSPDLVVQSPSVSDNNVASGATFTLGATVRNQGSGSSDVTTLHYYRSTDATVSTSDTEVGTDAVRGLAASGASAESIDLTVPSSSGTYHYGACVDAVAGESDSGNNCSASVTITVAPVAPPATGASKLYWTDVGTDKIQRSNLDGSGVEDLVTTGLEFPLGIALDAWGGKMYWTDSRREKIQRSNLGGSGVEDLVTTGLVAPISIALDVSGGKMYWTDGGTAKIQRSNLDGSGVEDLVTTGLEIPEGIALDVSGGKMYWTDGGTAKIQRSNLDGSGVEDLVTTGLEGPFGIALDVSGGKMYWTDFGTDKIQRSNLDGSGVEDLVTTGLEGPFGIALDVSGGKMYWTDFGTDKIQRSNLDGSGVEDLVTTGLEGLRGIGLDFVPVEAGKDLGVWTSVSDNTLTPGQSFTLSVTVRNRGTEQAAATTLRYYRSDDATIDATDTEIGTAAVTGLASLATTADSIDLTAPASTGTYYYGACVDAVTGESDTGNNCSAAVSITVAAVIPTDDRAALVALYEATDGPNWTDKENWSSAAPLGEWYGVTTDDNGRVTNLNLTDNSLQGAILVELGQLTNLTELDLSENQLTGAIPVELGQLTNLTWLDLRDNQLTGAIPVELGQLAKLRGLHLDVNTLTGPIPVELGQLTNLTYLYLSWNQLTGAIPVELGQLTKLTHLYLSDNQLTGAIPVELGQLTKLTSLSLFNNQLTGAIPVELGQLTKLTHLYLSDNQLTGAIPIELGQLTNLTTLNLSNNALTDAIPQSLTGLTKLDQFSFYHTGLCAPLNAAFQTWLQGIDEALGENCSGTPPPSGSPDLIVESPVVNVGPLTTGQSFTVGATVRNQGNASSASTTLRYYRSTDTTISSNDVEVGTDGVSSLSAGDTSDEFGDLTAPSSAGIYYYGACVDPVSGESNTGNNCSAYLTVTVSSAGSPDLIVESPSVNDNTLTTGQSFTLRATVRNQGNASSASTTLRYYRSSASSDTEVGTDGVSSLPAGDTSAESISLTAPSEAGTYYYAACVDPVTGESDTGNNCSAAVTVTVGASPAPDLVVDAPTVSTSSPTAGASFTLRATVRNRGTGRSGSTTLRYYLSTDATVSASDTQVGTDLVSAISASRTSAESISLNALSDAGTYYYGACVESVSDESDTGNNCSSAVTVTVGAAPAPDLVVDAPTVSTSSPTAGASFTLRATVRNQGAARSGLTTLRYYRSTDATVSTSDTEVGTDLVSSLSASRTSSESIFLSAPSNAGTYYYGACVESVSDETDTGNNCSSAVTVTVGAAPAPDLVVDAPTVSNSSPTGGASFTLRATVRNQGTGRSGSTTLRYYLSTDATVSTSDTEVGTDPVSALSASRTSAESISLRAPSSAGTYYYGACVGSVSDESDTGNNCSSSVTVTVGAPDLVVGTPRANPSNPTAGASFYLSVTVENQGNGRAAGTTLRFYRSTDATISASDTDVGSHAVPPLPVTGGFGGYVANTNLTAPSNAGTYYYGACVESVSDETDTGNNCSSAVTVTVGAAPAPDLVVDSPTVSNSSPTAGVSFTLSATVRNQGSGTAAATTLRWYRSDDPTVSTSDTEVGTDLVGILAASHTSSESITLTAPSSAGTYYYGTCVESVSDESDTGNNCSAAVTVTVVAAPPPDLVVDSPTVSNNSSPAGEGYYFTLSATVRNQGSGVSAATTLRWYLSTDATVSTSDTEVGTNLVSILSASHTSFEAITLSAPSSAGTYYYGACVESVSDESHTGNNCSSAVTLTVGNSGAPDLVVYSPSVSPFIPTAGASFRLSATVGNQGNGQSAATTLRFYRSTDGTISASDTEVGSHAVGGLAASGTSDHSTDLTAPSGAGKYYYGACVESVSDETDTGNNCSPAVTVYVGAAPAPDLVVLAPRVSDFTPTGGSSFTLSAIVLNQGDGQSAATTLRFYRSTDETISASDTEVGSHAVGGLSAYGTGDNSTDLTAPSSAGKYYYGACVESVSDESDTGNNCSPVVTVNVVAPDLVVLAPSVSDSSPTGGASFTLSATVRNQGTGQSAATTLRFYRSTDETISASDTEVGSHAVGGLSAYGISDHSTDLTAPSSAGTYYYGACVESVSDETDTGNNCSPAVTVNVVAPDLVVLAPSVSKSSPTGGASFTLSATVRNQGNDQSAATTLRFYRSTDATISDSDTEVGSQEVSGLAASGTSDHSTDLTAPASAGTYYYGACVESDSDETDTGNNCSAAVTVTVTQVWKLYWTDAGTDKIQRSNLDGSGVEDLVTTGLQETWSIALDVSGGKMYWTDAGTDKIQRSNLDGSGVEDLVTTGLDRPTGIALDVSGGKMYWADWGTADKIQRSNLDGSGVEDLVTTGLVLPFSVALDVSGGRMYWADYAANKIQRSNLDGSGVEDLVTTGLWGPFYIALDVSGGKMYWTNFGRVKIQRSNLDGSGVEDLVTTGLSGPRGIALDVSGGKMYWADSGSLKIQRSNLDGSGVEDLITTGLETIVYGIALGPVPVVVGTD